MLHLFKNTNLQTEECFNIETSVPLTAEQLRKLKLILADGFVIESARENTQMQDSNNLVELGPRMNFETAWSSNMISICHSVGLKKVIRIERSRRYIVSEVALRNKFIADHHDRMTECFYPEQLNTFSTGIVPEDAYKIPLMEEGPDALKKIPGIFMDDWDCQLYYDYFVVKHKRNPTIVEIMDLNNANSEHSRHGYFKGKQIINGEEMPETLLEVVMSTWLSNNKNSVIAFNDNSSGIYGRKIWTIIPEHPGKASAFKKQKCCYHIIFTAETHNFPTGVAPFSGAETGTGGRIRDIQATGKGGLVIAGTTGYCVANLFIPDYELPWECESERPKSLANALQIAIQASNGASDYGNKFGEPVIQGFIRSFDLRLPDNKRWGWLKPIMFTAGVGQIDDQHIKKDEPKAGMLIVQIGGPAYRVGFGGGAASSLIQGQQDVKLDFNAVQRGNAEMEQKMNRVIRACIEMGGNNPIVSIHDQGAGGPANVLKELVEKSGGKIDIRKINVGDPTMSVLEIWVAEYQERNGLLIYPDRIEEFKAICVREKVNCEVLGWAMEDGVFTVYDAKNSTKPVELNLQELLGNMPQKTFEDESIDSDLKVFVMPDNETFMDALSRVLRLVSVGSKRFLTNKVDRSVTGLIAQQQCCGPLQLTVSDIAITAQSHFPTNDEAKYSGMAISIGEQPIKMLVDPTKGAKMAVGEALTNLVWAKINGLQSIKCSANWMWAPKLPGEGAALYKAATAMREAMIDIGIAIDGGKDSLSMATKIGDEIVKSPRELVISAYSSMPDITKVITPDIKKPGRSKIIFIDLAKGKARLGGSALAHVYGQIGNDSPDLEDPTLIKNAFNAIQELIEKDLILAGHDISDGGIIVGLLEMAFAGNCGLDIGAGGCNKTVFEKFFSEELGLLIECDDVESVLKVFESHDVWLTHIIAETVNTDIIKASFNFKDAFNKSMTSLRRLWEETSYQLERLQMNPKCAKEEKNNIFKRTGPKYYVSFKPVKTSANILLKNDKPKIAILREEGANSDREMASAFFQAGFAPWDVTMTDLINGRISLDMFRGLVAVGGFSYADVPESAKGWASTILFNEKLRAMFDEFYDRNDTFSLGVCNGCQLFALLGWVPWKDIPTEDQPRFIHNDSGRFESRWSTVRIIPSAAIMFKDMKNSNLGIWVAHGEGRLHLPNIVVHQRMIDRMLVPLVFTDDDGNATEKYPFNPNGSPSGITALCDSSGRHLAMMPHPERSFLKWQWPWLPKEFDKKWVVSPWLKMFQNAREWCE